MTNQEFTIFIVFIGFVLLPWLGSLVLTALNFWFVMRRNMQLKIDLNSQMCANVDLNKEIDRLRDELSKSNLTLQTTLVENAMLSSRLDKNV